MVQWLPLVATGPLPSGQHILQRVSPLKINIRLKTELNVYVLPFPYIMFIYHAIL